MILSTASIVAEVPPWFGATKQGGWTTCDYVMLPASTPRRKDWPKLGHTDSRGTEIQRIIGRSLRAVIDLTKIGPHTIHVDCQVLQADGGTRTASICAAWLALNDALSKLPRELPPEQKQNNPNYDPKRGLVDQLAAVSVGIVEGEVRVDLDYHDDSRADVDLNVAYTASGKFVEVQGSAEKCAGFDRKRLDEMLDAAEEACKKILEIQTACDNRQFR